MTACEISHQRGVNSPRKLASNFDITHELRLNTLSKELAQFVKRLLRGSRGMSWCIRDCIVLAYPLAAAHRKRQVVPGTQLLHALDQEPISGAVPKTKILVQVAFVQPSDKPGVQLKRLRLRAEE